MTNKLNNPFKITELISTVNELDTNKQDTLISGTNIKTINGSNILGNGNLIVTADTNDCVHKTGNEIIGGIKTLYSQDGVNLITKSNHIDDDYTPSAQQFSNYLDNMDINNKLLTRIYTTKRPSGTNAIGIQAWKGETNYVIEVFSDGNTLAPPSDAVDSIVTTTGINKSHDGYVKFGNGIIIQWGGISSSSYSQLTINFPTSFSNSNYKIILTQEHYNHTGEYNANAYVRSKTNTSCNILGQADYIAYIAIGY